MNIFVTTYFKLRYVRHTELVRLLKEDNLDVYFSEKITKGKLKQHYSERCNGHDGIEEMKSKTGKPKFLVSDCFQESNNRVKIGCWWCREKQGFQANGIPLEIIRNRETGENLISTYGYFCDDRCMYAFAYERAVFGARDYWMYKKACENAEMLHALKNTEEGCLTAANDWALLKFNGGTLEYDMWKDKKMSFEVLPNYNTSTVSFAYLQK